MNKEVTKHCFRKQVLKTSSCVWWSVDTISGLLSSPRPFNPTIRKTWPLPLRQTQKHLDRWKTALRVPLCSISRPWWRTVLWGQIQGEYLRKEALPFFFSHNVSFMPVQNFFKWNWWCFSAYFQLSEYVKMNEKLWNNFPLFSTSNSNPKGGLLTVTPGTDTWLTRSGFKFLAHFTEDRFLCYFLVKISAGPSIV